MSEYDTKSPRDYLIDRMVHDNDNYFHEYPQSEPPKDLVDRFESALDYGSSFDEYYFSENIHSSIEQVHNTVDASREVSPKDNIPAARMVSDIAQQILSKLQIRQGALESPQLFMQLRNVGFLTGTGITMEMLGDNLNIRFSANSIDSLNFFQAHEVGIKEWLSKKLDNVEDINITSDMEDASNAFADSDQGSRNPYQNDEDTPS